MAFVAIVGNSTDAVPAATRAALRAAGAEVVLGWADLTVAEQSDDSPAMFFDLPPEGAGLADRAVAALAELGRLDGLANPVPGRTATMIVTTRPVTDTLKLLDSEGELTGTTRREEYRSITPPLTARLGVLRWAYDAGPDLFAVLNLLLDRGVTLISLPS